MLNERLIFMSSLITRAITSDGSARMIVAQTTEIVQKAADIHKTSKTMTAALGRSLTAASLMGSLLKDKDNSLTFQSVVSVVVVTIPNH
jgi:molecular chaperone Hsp33